VAAAQQRDQGQPNLLTLADDDALDVGRDALAGLLNTRHLSLFRTQRFCLVIPSSVAEAFPAATPSVQTARRIATYYAETPRRLLA
jgi:hypothetical protein